MAQFINDTQTPETRRAKYALAKSLGATAEQANTMRDYRVTTIFRKLGLPVPDLKKRRKLLRKFGATDYLKPKKVKV